MAGFWMHQVPQSRSRHPGFFQSSQATVLELWVSLDLLRPPWTQLDTSWSHLDAKRPDHEQVGYQGGHFLPIIKLS